MSAVTAEQQEALQAEARRRVRRALAQIEEAQGQLNAATATLSSLQHALPQWKSTSAMADKVKAHWYRVRNALEFGPASRKVRLDPLAMEGFLSRQQAQRQPAGGAR